MKIASPIDVTRERNLVRDVIAEWNAIYSESTATVLMPIAWETHASPSADGAAQHTISKQLLSGCDLLIATFWTRVGSPTGTAPSGTVHEIREHIQAKKQAMIYFSSVPVRPDAIDEEQYNALKAFEEECFAKYLVETYETLAEYRQKLVRQLAITMIRHSYREP